MTQRLMGHYEVVEKIGAGGMGEVFRARDTKLGREVALKLLPPFLAQDHERLARFQREAKVLASLNHAHIATLHGLEEHDGTPFLVMEMVSGEDLAQRLSRGPIPVDEALTIARSVAEALAAAHDQGIVHRDLKPANIKLTAGGDVKVLDFGLAKAFDTDPVLGDISHSPTITGMAGTMQGTILGTAAYMSPEQARGKPIDKRTDIWAFGCVVYELLTGDQCFPGETVSDTIAKILEREPEWAKLPEETPLGIQRLLRRCLTKDPKRRLQDIADARNEIDLVKSGDPLSSGISIADTQHPRQDARRRPPLLWMALSAILLVVAAVSTVGYFRQAREQMPLYRLSIASEPGASFVSRGDYAGPVSVSPDGRHVAYVARDAEAGRMLWVRDLDAATARRMAGTELCTFPFWSADSRSIGFFAGGKLKRVEIDGGLPITLCDADAGRGGTWSASGDILFSPTYRAGIYRVPQSGGTPQVVTELDSTKHTTHRWPSALPDGKHFLYMAANHDVSHSSEYAIHYAAIDGSEDRELLKAATQGAYASGYLLHVREHNLIAIPFDPARGEFTGDPVPLTDKVASDPTTWISNFSVSQNGVLAYHVAVQDENANSRIAIYDRTGAEIELVDEDDAYFSLTLSPNGKELAVTAGATAIGVWIIDIERHVRKRATFDPNTCVSPQWSPDSRWIAYSTLSLATSDHSTIYRVPADGGTPEKLLAGENGDVWVCDWSPDGRNIIFCRGDYVGTSAADIWALPMTGGTPGEPFPILTNDYADYNAQLSPDGRWLLFTSEQSGRTEIYVVPFVEPARREEDRRSGQWQVSTHGGNVAVWGGDGKTLYYVSLEDEVIAVAVDGSGDRFQIGREQTLFQGNFWDLAGVGFDVSSDAQRFILNSFTDRSELPATVVINWTRELRR